MDKESLQFFAQLGVGGALAGAIFFFTRRDIDRYISEWKGQAQMLVEIVKTNTAAMTEVANAIRELRQDIEDWDGRERRDGHGKDPR